MPEKKEQLRALIAQQKILFDKVNPIIERAIVECSLDADLPFHIFATRFVEYGLAMLTLPIDKENSFTEADLLRFTEKAVKKNCIKAEMESTEDEWFGVKFTTTLYKEKKDEV